MTLINPGSRIGGNPDGWSNTAETARAEAERWLARMTGDGIADVELLDEVNAVDGGRWQFTFRHTVTGTQVALETHGIDDLDAYREQYTFDPKVYWNGSSSGNPTLEDFAAPGFEAVQTHRPAEATARQLTAPLTAEVERLQADLKRATDKADRYREMHDRAAHELSDERVKTMELAMTKVWINEDGMRFMFVADVQDALGLPREAETPDGDARERLARHLNMQSTASMDKCRRHADAILAVLAGREG